jgi:predicted protein tyrosine phosphatase
MKLLFVCSQNRLRSPTAEHHFSLVEGMETASAGTNRSAEVPLSAELVEWADIVFCMERLHAERLRQRFDRHLGGRRVVCLDIPDRYEYMDPSLIGILERKVKPHLRRRKG